MKLLKLTVLTSLCFALFLGFSSCEKDAEKNKVTVYTKSDLAITGAQNVPQSTSPALGKLSVYYDTRVKLLYYTISWSGLTGAPNGIGIFGPAPAGYIALSGSAPAAALQTISTTGLGISGSLSGTLFVDGFKISEQSLLNYLYYVRISTAANPLGEIRAQIKFQ